MQMCFPMHSPLPSTHDLLLCANAAGCCCCVSQAILPSSALFPSSLKRRPHGGRHCGGGGCAEGNLPPLPPTPTSATSMHIYNYIYATASAAASSHTTAWSLGGILTRSMALCAMALRARELEWAAAGGRVERER